MAFPQDKESAISNKIFTSLKAICLKTVGKDEPAHLESVDGCTKCRFHLIESWYEIIHGHFDVLLIYLLWKVCRIHLPEAITKQ